MVTSMASARRAAYALAAALMVSPGWAADAVAPSTYTPLPPGYSLSYEKDKWTQQFSVFHMMVTDPVGVVGFGFAASDDPRLRPLTRLDSSWNLTAPVLGLPVRVGDGVSSVSFWNQPARVGGIQIGSYQPALPEVLAPPSMVVVPFTTIGSNPMTATTRYVETLRAMAQFQTQVLQSPGQGAFSFESGRLRQNFEVRSADYGPWLTSGTYRYGVNTATTVDGQAAQVSGQQSYLGFGILEGFGALGTVSAKVAGSREPLSSGWLARMGYDFSHERMSVALRSHIQSPGFHEVGDSSLVESFRQRTLATTRVDLGTLGKISVASATQTYASDSRRDMVALSHAMLIGGGGIISTAAAYSPGQIGNSAVLLSFTYPFNYIAAPAHKLSGAVNTALDRTIMDAFAQTHIPVTGRFPSDRF